MTRKNKSKITKRCSECGKNLQEQNKSGLCRHHYIIEYNKRTRAFEERLWRWFIKMAR